MNKYPDKLNQFKADKIKYYTAIKDKGFWRYSLKYSFIITVIIEIISFIYFGSPKLLPLFFYIYLPVFLLVALTWLFVLTRLDFYKTYPGKPIPWQMAIITFAQIFIWIAIVLMALFFPKQFEELKRKKTSYENDKTIEKFDLLYSLEPVENKLQFSDGSITLTAPKAYLLLKNYHKEEGVFSERLATSKIHLAAQLPDLEPWKLTKNALEYLQEREHNLKLDHESESAVYEILREDSNFVSINLIDGFSATSDDIASAEKSMLADMAESQNKVTSEYKYGLYLRTTKTRFRTIINGQHAFTYKEVGLATPVGDGYPPSMKFACDSVCTIIGNYKKNIDISVSFNASHLENWQDIWKKANSKVDTMIKWD